VATYGQIRFQLQQAFPTVPVDLLDSWIVARHEWIMGQIPWDRLEQQRPLSTVAEYTTGTVNVENGSVIVTGTGTAWTSALGDLLRINNEQDYYRFRADGVAVGTIDQPYRGTTGSYTYQLLKPTYALTDDIRLVREVYRTSGGPPLQRLDRAQFNRNYAGRMEEGEPRVWTSYFDSDSAPPVTQIEFYPSPRAVQGFVVEVAIDKAGILRGRTGTSLLPWESSGCLVSGVSNDACLWLMTQPGATGALSSAADRHAANFAEQLDQMVKADVARRGSVKLQPSSAGRVAHRIRRWAGYDNDPVNIRRS
jgi:hypothetical protein